MLDWLKDILGETYTEEIGKKVSAEIGKGFVARADYNVLNEAKKGFESQLGAANAQIERFRGMDVDGIQAAADTWKQKAEKAEKDAAEKIAAMQFDALLDGVIRNEKGRSTKAIKALLDVETLKASKKPEDDAKVALESLRKDNGYLFEDGILPPVVVRPTGKVCVTPESFKGLSYLEKLKLKTEQPGLYESIKAGKNGGNE